MEKHLIIWTALFAPSTGTPKAEKVQSLVFTQLPWLTVSTVVDGKLSKKRPQEPEHQIVRNVFIRALWVTFLWSLLNILVGNKVLITVSFFHPNFDALTFLKVGITLLYLLSFLKFSFWKILYFLQWCTWKKTFYLCCISACKKVFQYCFVQFNGSRSYFNLSYTSWNLE